MSLTVPAFTFSDLFAGIGGFHAALHAGAAVGLRERDRPRRRRVYDYNWCVRYVSPVDAAEGVER